jgi:hypothetical protein
MGMETQSRSLNPLLSPELSPEETLIEKTILAVQEKVPCFAFFLHQAELCTRTEAIIVIWNPFMSEITAYQQTYEQQPLKADKLCIGP